VERRDRHGNTATRIAAFIKADIEIDKAGKLTIAAN